MEFKDRVANKPNRIKLTYEDGGVSVYATVELADEPIEEGTPLNAINMNKLLNKENNDYIVEQGTSGIWTYRKWASGIAECWGRKYCGSVAVTTEWGYLFESTQGYSENYPENLFKDMPCCFYTLWGDGGLMPQTVGDGSVVKTPELFFVRPLPKTFINCNIEYYATGRWK